MKAGHLECVFCLVYLMSGSAESLSGTLFRRGASSYFSFELNRLRLTSLRERRGLWSIGLIIGLSFEELADDRIVNIGEGGLLAVVVIQGHLCKIISVFGKGNVPFIGRAI